MNTIKKINVVKFSNIKTSKYLKNRPGINNQIEAEGISDNLLIEKLWQKYPMISYREDDVDFTNGESRT